MDGEAARKKTAETAQLRQKAKCPPGRHQKAWDAVTDAGKAIPMQMFMLWMSGNSVQIFSIMITGMLLFNGAKGIGSVNAVFDKFQSAENQSSLLVQKMAFVLVQFALIGLGLYKCHAMGLLPTSHSDWLSFLPAKTPLEWSVGPGA